MKKGKIFAIFCIIFYLALKFYTYKLSQNEVKLKTELANKKKEVKKLQEEWHLLNQAQNLHELASIHLKKWQSINKKQLKSLSKKDQ